MTDNNPDDTDTTRRGVLRGAATAGAALLPVSVAGTAAASHASGMFQGGDLDDVDADWRAFAGGLLQRVRSYAAARSGLDSPDDTPAQSIRDDLRDRVDETSADLVAWANDRGFGAGVTTVAVTIDQAGETAGVVLDASYDGEWTSIDAVDEDAFGGTVGERVELAGSAARNAPDEYDEFYETFVEPDEPLTSAYVSRMAGKYGDSENVASTLLGDSP